MSTYWNCSRKIALSDVDSTANQFRVCVSCVSRSPIEQFSKTSNQLAAGRDSRHTIGPLKNFDFLRTRQWEGSLQYARSHSLLALSLCLCVIRTGEELLQVKHHLTFAIVVAAGWELSLAIKADSGCMRWFHNTQHFVVSNNCCLFEASLEGIVKNVPLRNEIWFQKCFSVFDWLRWWTPNGKGHSNRFTFERDILQFSSVTLSHCVLWLASVK